MSNKPRRKPQTWYSFVYTIWLREEITFVMITLLFGIVTNRLHRCDTAEYYKRFESFMVSEFGPIPHMQWNIPRIKYKRNPCLKCSTSTLRLFSESLGIGFRDFLSHPFWPCLIFIRFAKFRFNANKNMKLKLESVLYCLYAISV